jgi:hypothetical protein
MLFSHLLPPERVSAMLDAYTRQSEEKLAQLTGTEDTPQTPGERFVAGLGNAIYVAMLDFLKTHRADIETQAPQAAE